MQDTANDALIARALWAQEEGEDVGAGAGDTSDSDYEEHNARKKLKRGRGRGRGGAGAASGSGRASSGAAGDASPPHGAKGRGGTAAARRPRRDVGHARTAGRAWSAEEEASFEAALALHGRDWKACAAHVGTRDARAIASHAQKHFIKLALTGQALPEKVAATGPGYTLSGRLLDPNSAAARAYGFRPEVVIQLEPERLQTVLTGIVREGLPHNIGASGGGGDGDGTGQGAAAAPPRDAAAPVPQALAAARQAPPAKPKRQASAKRGAPPGEAAAATAPLERAARTGRGARRAAWLQGSDEDDEEAAAAAVGQLTEYARHRPRREGAGQRATLGDTSESLELLQCCDFHGPPGSGMPLAQPFAVEVACEAVVTMEVHAHLSSHEIIGLLGGSWDAAARTMRVAQAYPCRAAQGTGDRTSVELDPGSEVEARAQMEERGQRCVGWYHSHPVFEPSPSQKDCDNQRNYQALCRDETSKAEPFLGFILGPYDTSLPSLATAVTAFVVQRRAQGLQPFNVRYAVRAPERVASPEQRAALAALLCAHEADPARVDLASNWRTYATIDKGWGYGPPVSKLDKLLGALRVQLARADSAEVEGFMAWLLTAIQEAWGVTVQPTDPAGLEGAAAPPDAAAAPPVEEEGGGGVGPSAAASQGAAEGQRLAPGK